MEVAKGKYGLLATPIAKEIIFKIFLVYFFERATFFPLIYIKKLYLLRNKYEAMQDSHCRENYNKEGKMGKSK